MSRLNELLRTLCPDGVEFKPLGEVIEYEQPGKLYKDSVGHSGVKCVVCHNSPHAITPTVTPADNLQMIRVQGHAGTLNKCTVCHRNQPNEAFFHRRNDD